VAGAVRVGGDGDGVGVGRWGVDSNADEEVNVPFKSKAQERLFWAKVGRGEISKEKAEEWEAETPNRAKLPERVKKPAPRGGKAVKPKPRPASKPRAKPKAKPKGK